MMMPRSDGAARGAAAGDDLPRAKRVHAYAPDANTTGGDAGAAGASATASAAALAAAQSPVQSPASPASPGVFGGGVSPSPSPTPSVNVLTSADARGKRAMTQEERDRHLAEALAPLTQYTAINHMIRDAHLSSRQRAEHDASLADVERARLSTEPQQQQQQQDAAHAGHAAASPASASPGVAVGTRKRGADGPPT